MVTVRWKVAFAALALAATAGAGSGAGSAVHPVLSNDGSVYGYYLASRFATRQYAFEDGLEHLKRAIAASPKDLALKAQAMYLHATLGNINEAAELARELALFGVSHERAATVLMVDAVRQGNFDIASDYGEALSGDGINLVAKPLLRAWSLAGQGKVDEAIILLQSEAASEIADTPLLHYHIALLQEMGGQLELAELSYLKALGAGDAKAQRIIEATGSFYERHRGKQAAQAFYEKLLAESSDNWFAREGLNNLAQGLKAKPAVSNAAEGFAEVLFNSAGMVYSNDDTAEALCLAGLSLHLKPSFANAYMMRAAMLDEMDSPEKARRDYQTIAKDSAFYWRAQVEQALALYKMGREPQAIQALTELTTVRPNSYDPYVNIADIQKSSGRYKEAAVNYTVAIKKIGTLQGWHWPLFYARGISHERSGDWGKAEADFQKALELKPDQPDVLNYLAYSWLERGKNLQQARAMLSKALEQKPDDASILDSYGWAHYKLGDVEKAVFFLEQAAELEPSDAVINDHLGDAYWAVGRKKEARFQWTRTLTLEPDATLTANLHDKISNGLGAAIAATQQAGERVASELVERASNPSRNRE